MGFEQVLRNSCFFLLSMTYFRFVIYDFYFFIIHCPNYHHFLQFKFTYYILKSLVLFFFHSLLLTFIITFNLSFSPKIIYYLSLTTSYHLSLNHLFRFTHENFHRNLPRPHLKYCIQKIQPSTLNLIFLFLLLFLQFFHQSPQLVLWIWMIYVVVFAINFQFNFSAIAINFVLSVL